MSGYPYPLRNWHNPSEYAAPGALSLAGWAWEFLRRNPEYQRLWDVFAALPDYLDREDERGPFSYSKHGKWRGTPHVDFRFLTDGAGWYADPEPVAGEHVSEYEARCPDGYVLPFADYLMKRFRLLPWPIAPNEELSEHHWFSDEWGRRFGSAPFSEPEPAEPSAA